MPYSVRTDEKNGIVCVVVRDLVTPDQHAAARRQAAKLLRGRKFRRLLVDLRELQTRGVITTLSCYDFGASYLRDGIPPDCMIAHVMPANSEAHRDVSFIATVGINRGLQIREFDDDAGAKAWLLGEKEDKEAGQPPPE